jgi:uracil-DNA glycosylase family protein
MATTEFSVAKPPTGVGLEGVRKAALRCRACPLWEPATQTVFGKGPADARVLFVGEQPGDVEDRKGEPFVGPAGKLLDQALEEAGIDRSTTYVTNAVKHFKWKARGTRRIHDKPTWTEVMACRPWLDAELALVQPRALVLLGATAAQALLGTSFRVTQERGRPLDSELADLVIATIHPSAVLRAENRDEMFAGLVDDLRVVSRTFAR